MNKTEVFLSFKNSDANGNSTKERAMADELYNALANRGIGVFIATKRSQSVALHNTKPK